MTGAAGFAACSTTPNWLASQQDVTLRIDEVRLEKVARAALQIPEVVSVEGRLVTSGGASSQMKVANSLDEHFRQLGIMWPRL